MARGDRNRFAAFVNSPAVVTWFLVLAAVGCSFGAVVSYNAAAALRDRGERAVGEVLEVHDYLRTSYVVVRFVEGRGHVVTTEVGNYRWDPKPEVGDQPELLYDPLDPSGNVADVRTGPDFSAVWFFVVGALLAAGLVVPTWTGRLDWEELGR